MVIFGSGWAHLQQGDLKKEFFIFSNFTYEPEHYRMKILFWIYYKMQPARGNTGVNRW